MSQLSMRYIVEDVDAAIGFYTEALGFAVDLHPAPGFAALSRDGARLMLNAPGAGGAGRTLPGAGTPEPGGWNRLMVEVEDLDVMVERLTRAGANFRSEPVQGQGGRQVLVEDPSGNPVELFEPRSRGAEGDDAPQAPAASDADLAPIRHEVLLDLPPAEAFALFTARLGEWWPLAYTFSGSAFAGALVEPRVGGRWLERDGSGRELPWGEVRAYEEGRRLVLSFAIGADRRPTDPQRASEVELIFEPAAGGATRVEVEHRDFAAHGEDGATLRAGMGSPQGWPLILAELRRATRRG
jgi:uncharacterized protein YndB with AHSA1/START domain/catechol 2,3-dioxygenase-like lactoylglutathione lyase family enzyme